MTGSTAVGSVSPTRPTSRHRSYPLGWILAVLAGIVLMGITAFFRLIQHDLLPAIFLASPMVAGFVGAAAILVGDRFAWREAKLWAAILIVASTFCVAMMLYLMVYVLPLGH
ncbi:hypothetical protein ACTQ49_07675 [Luteococcus sp. Sow4_B9]|uniref:hypothetical protein n=1 Tax=Luteococcus sp. Sow4_B9 TaxID=3438792 RepID=UPI003F98C627